MARRYESRAEEGKWRHGRARGKHVQDRKREKSSAGWGEKSSIVERERGSEKPGCSAYAYNDQPPTPPMGVLDSSSSPRVVVTMADDK